MSFHQPCWDYPRTYAMIPGSYKKNMSLQAKILNPVWTTRSNKVMRVETSSLQAVVFVYTFALTLEPAPPPTRCNFVEAWWMIFSKSRAPATKVAALTSTLHSGGGGCRISVSLIDIVLRPRCYPCGFIHVS
jgi:hypothetical protein